MTVEIKHDSTRPWLIPEMEGRSSNSFLLEERRAKPQGMPTAEELAQLRAAAREEGYREGYAEGHKKGFAKGELEARVPLEKELADKREQLKNILETLSRPLNSIDEQAEQALLRLAVSIARTIIKRELQSDPGQIISVIREAVGLLPQSRQAIHIYLHPADVQLMRDLFHEEVGNNQWLLHEEAGQQRGGCRIATDDSQIDASLENRISGLVEHLYAVSDHYERISNESKS